jgi:predicted CXXCH cytochrome family protein
MIFYTIKNLRKNSIFLCSQRIIALIVLLLCLLAGPVLAEQGLALKADTSKKCAICHYKWVSTFFIEHRNTPIAHAEEKSLEMFSRELCISCHDSSIRDSRSSICNDPGHQVGRVPSKRIKIPPAFPLDEKGALKCTTCHTPHAVTEQSASMVTYFLRAPNENSSFCRTCHQQKLGGLAKGNHPIDVTVNTNTAIISRAGGKFGTQKANQIICETCHRAHGGVNNKRLVLPVENISSTSVLCEVCHSKNALRPGETPGKERSHPVDIRPGKGMQIPKNWSNGEKVVVGKNGEIVCRTCHKPHRAMDKEFLLSDYKGKGSICVQCHRRTELKSDLLPDLETSEPIKQKGSEKTVAESFPCTSCHLLHNGSAAFSKVINDSSDLEMFFRIPHFGLHSQEFFRTAFIEKEGIANHEILLFTPNGEPSSNGTIACSTCHNLQKLSPAKTKDNLDNSNDNSTNGFLKPKIAENLCKTCHGEEALTRYLYFHKKW